MIEFSEDVGVLDTIDAVNEELKPYGISFLEVDGSHDEAVAWKMIIPKSLENFEEIKTLVAKCPLGYYQGRLLKQKSVTEQDVVNWLVNLNKMVGNNGVRSESSVGTMSS